MQNLKTPQGTVKKGIAHFGRENTLASLNITINNPIPFGEVTFFNDSSNIVLTSATRVLLRDKLDKTKFDINNYIKRLKEKKLIIVKEDKSLHINPNIIELMKFKTITFKLKD